MKHLSLILAALALTGAPALAQTTHGAATKAEKAMPPKQEAAKTTAADKSVGASKKTGKHANKHALSQKPAKN